MPKQKRKDPLIEALKNKEPYTVTMADGGDFASMRAILKHGQTLTFSPIEDFRRVHVGDIVIVAWRGGNYMMHLVGDIRDDQYLIVNSLGKENGWVRGDAILGHVTEIIDPEPRPDIPDMLTRLDAAYHHLVKRYNPVQEDKERLYAVVADMRWYAAQIGSDRWAEQPQLNYWSFEQNLWHITRQVESAVTAAACKSIRYYINHGKEHVGKVAEILTLFAGELNESA